MKDHIFSGALEMNDGKISAVHAAPCISTTDLVTDAQGRYLSPGFVDIHTHGAGGADFMDGTPQSFVTAAKMQLAHGATSIVPTTLTSTTEELFRSIDCFRKAKRTIRGGPTLLGLHLEGPYFCEEQKGAQDARYLRNPSPAEYLSILDYANGEILRWSAAPERPGVLPFARELCKRGVYPSIGHSNAQHEQVCAAYDSGFRHVTHLYSSMSTITRKNGFRCLGVVESAYILDGLKVEVIADGCHLPPALLTMIYKIKGPEKICLVTDSMRAAGLSDGPSILGSLENGQAVLVEDGVAKMPDRSGFAGSVATCDRLVRVMYHQASISLCDCVTMMTDTPARSVGFGGKKGSLAPGADADVVLFDENIQISGVFVAGERVI